MTYKTYQEAREAAIAHHQKGEFAEAMEIFAAVRPQFPDDRVDIDYFRSCLAVRLDDTALTYQILDDLLAAVCFTRCGFILAKGQIDPLE